MLFRARHPRVTVLMPAYDSSAYIGDAIRAVLAQTYAHVELLVAPDDGDTYRHLRNKFISPQLRIIPPGPAPKSGAGAARNRALDASSGEFFTVLDADDLIEPTYIADLMRVALVKGAAIATSRYTSWDADQVIRIPPMHRGQLSLSGFGQLVASLRPLLHRELETGYCEGFAEDVVHDGLLVARLGTVEIVESACYTTRIRSGSECGGATSELLIQQEYDRRVDQILRRPSELGMQCLGWEGRQEFAELFRFRAFVSEAFSRAGGDCYNAWVAGKEADLWDQFKAAANQITNVATA